MGEKTGDNAPLSLIHKGAEWKGKVVHRIVVANG